MPTFTAPRFEEASESLLIDNILAIIKRDLKLALDYYYAADLLPDLVERALGSFQSTDYPKLAIDPNRNEPDESADASWIEEGLRINIFLAVTAADAPAVTRKLMKYLRALKSILRTAPSSDYLTGFPSGSIFAPVLKLSYIYWPIAKDDTQYMRVVQVDLLIKFNER